MANTADIDTIMKDIQALKNDIAALMDHVKTGATATVSDEARRIYDAIASESERSVAALTQKVEERPVASLLVAFGVGLLAGRVLVR
jgi:ElaB/YqjD/DUF883 family membrane-anchored ribosome-binding protein